jgi:hypothetical protein
MFDLDLAEKPVDLAGGEWVGDIPNHPGVRFKVRSRNYKPFTVAHDRLLRSFGKRAAQAQNTPEYQKAAGALISEHLLLDWENAVKKDAKSVAYDRKVADQVLTSIDDRGMGQTFRDAVAYASGVVADRHLGMAEEIAGN